MKGYDPLSPWGRVAGHPGACLERSRKTPKFAILGIPEIVLPPRDSAWQRRLWVSKVTECSLPK